MNRRWLWGVMTTVLLIGLMGGGTALAEGPPPQAGDNGACLSCHSNPDLTYEFPSGEIWSLYVDEEVFSSSIHGQQGLACTACHPDIQGYPHPPLEASSRRTYQVGQYQNCRQCHEEVYQQSLDSIHAREIAGGNFQAAICTDCHGSHAATPPNDPGE